MLLLTLELLILLVIDANAISEIVNGSCNFDLGTCGWQVNSGVKSVKYTWKLHRGHTTRTKTGPDGDHTTASKNGSYFYTISRSGSNNNDVTDLQSVLINSSPKQCLTFWYHMYGKHINTLKVFQQNISLWSESGNQGNKWHFKFLSLNYTGQYHIMFRATRGEGFTSEIAVDDISIYNSECKKVDNTSKTSDASVTIATRYTRDGSKEIDTTLISDTSDTSGTVDSSDTTTVDISNVINTGDTSDANDTSDAGMIVGLIIGGLLLACVVIVTIVFIRRHIFKRRPREKIRNNLRENDYIGTQDIALPLTANESGCIQTDGKNTNTAYTVRWNTTVSDNSTLSDHRYSIVDQTPETTLNETKDGKGTTDSYMILDPSATGFNRTKLPNTYEFAKPVIDAENNIGDDDQYALSEEGVYDHSGNNRHKESEVNIYNHAVDTIYDCGSHKRKEEGREDTYDHFFGHKTEDDYDISTTT